LTLYYWLTGRKAKYVHSLHQKYGNAAFFLLNR
jgi:hypothetical protein